MDVGGWERVDDGAVLRNIIMVVVLIEIAIAVQKRCNEIIILCLFMKSKK